MPMPFDCDHCKQDTEGDVYQDRHGDMFVCEDCFNANMSEDEMYFELKPDPVGDALKLGGIEMEDGQ